MKCSDFFALVIWLVLFIKMLVMFDDGIGLHMFLMKLILKIR